MIHFDITKLETDLAELEKETMKENFWGDTQKSTQVLGKIKKIKSKCTRFNKIISIRT